MEPSQPPVLTGLILVDDLMFASQIQGLARTAGIQLQWVRSADKALELARTGRPACIILDVNLVGSAIGELVTGLKTAGDSVPVLIGFGSHVDAASLHRAREAGCDLVLPRSKLVQDIAANLSDLLKNRGG